MSTYRIGVPPSPSGWTPADHLRVITRLNDIELKLRQLSSIADEDGHDLLVYLINMAEVEARYVADEHHRMLND